MRLSFAVGALAAGLRRYGARDGRLSKQPAILCDSTRRQREKPTGLWNQPVDPDTEASASARQMHPSRNALNVPVLLKPKPAH